jgi:hypothetical protein
MGHVALDQNQVGDTIRLVGYGVSSGNDQQGATAGTKRQVMAGINSIDDLFIFLGDARHNTCEGDSGGPALLPRNGQEEIIGITSFGDQGCAMGGYDSRVDDYAATFVDPYIQQFDPGQMQPPPPPPDMAQASQGSADMAQGSSTTPDMAHGTGATQQPDMAAATVENPGGFGAICHDHAACKTHLCAFTSDDTGYCSARCTPGDATGCPDGYACGTVGGDSFCQPVLSSMGRGTSGCTVGAGLPACAPTAPLLAALALLAAALRIRRR